MPESQKSDPRTPKVRFFIDFGTILGTMFDQKFWFLQKAPEARFYWKTNEKSMILHLQSLPFPIKIPSKFQAFFNTPSQISFFRFLMLSDAKMLDFGTPLAPGSAQNDGRNYPSVAKNGFRKLLGELLLAQGRCRIAPGHQCGWFWMHLGWILDGFWMVF